MGARIGIRPPAAASDRAIGCQSEVAGGPGAVTSGPQFGGVVQKQAGRLDSLEVPAEPHSVQPFYERNRSTRAAS